MTSLPSLFTRCVCLCPYHICLIWASICYKNVNLPTILLVLRFEHKNTADRITDMGESVVTAGYSHVMGQFSHVYIHLLSISSTIENILQKLWWFRFLLFASFLIKLNDLSIFRVIRSENHKSSSKIVLQSFTSLAGK